MSDLEKQKKEPVKSDPDEKEKKPEEKIKENLKHLVAGPQTSDPKEICSWMTILAIALVIIIFIFFVLVDLMYMAAGFLAFCIVCGLCYGIYLLGRDYERKDEEEKDPDDADGREAETNKEFTEVDNKNKSTN